MLIGLKYLDNVIIKEYCNLIGYIVNYGENTYRKLGYIIIMFVCSSINPSDKLKTLGMGIRVACERIRGVKYSKKSRTLSFEKNKKKYQKKKITRKIKKSQKIKKK